MVKSDADNRSTSSWSVSELQSPGLKYDRASLSFTSPPSERSFSSPSPRQASLSFSSNNTCPLDYSTDADSLALLPISPVSLCDNDTDDQEQTVISDPCKASHSSVEMKQETLINVSTIAVLNGHINDIPNIAETDNIGIPPAELALSHEEANLDVPSHVVTFNKSSDSNRRNSIGQSALSITSSNCFLKGMMLLIEKGADVNLFDAHGRAPLHLACENTDSSEHHECIMHLIDHGAQVNLQDKSGASALHVAARKGCVQCIQILLDQGANTALMDSAGNTPLHVAAVHNNLSAMEALSPSLFEEESIVEEVDQPQLQNETPTSFYGSPREYYLQKEPESWPQNSGSNPMNDSSYYSATAWTKSSYYNTSNIPHRIEEEHNESSLDSLSDSLTVESLVIENESLANFVWLLVGIVVTQMKNLYDVIVSRTTTRSKPMISRTEPPEHVREAMERYKLSRQKTFKAGSAKRM